MDGSTFLLFIFVPEPWHKTNKSMKKKLSTLVLILLAATGLTHAYDFSAVTSSGHTLYYNIVAGDVEVTYPYYTYTWNGYPKPTGNLIIDSTVTYNGTSYRVISISAYAFYECSSLTSVNIPNSVTNIGDYAFHGCSGLTSPVYNSSCFAFLPRTHTGSYNIPENITNICGGAFYDCSGLTSVTIPNSVTNIGNSAFKNCTSLTAANIGDGVTDIGNEAFNGCLRLTSVSLGESVINIDSRAFKDCGIIGELVIPQSVTTIGDESFNNCYGINEITCLGRVAPFLGTNVFDGLDTSITVNIPCGAMNLYAGRWSYFHNFNEIPFLFNVASADLAQGTVTMVQEPSCDDPVAIVQATARNGYHFDHWSDGSIMNPYTCVVTGSMTLTAFFASDNGQNGIEETAASGPKVYTSAGRIIVEGCEGETIRVFDFMGRLMYSHSGQVSYALVVPKGVYIVCIGDRMIRKVIVMR